MPSIALTNCVETMRPWFIGYSQYKGNSTINLWDEKSIDCSKCSRQLRLHSTYQSQRPLKAKRLTLRQRFNWKGRAMSASSFTFHSNRVLIYINSPKRILAKSRINFMRLKRTKGIKPTRQARENKHSQPDCVVSFLLFWSLFYFCGKVYQQLFLVGHEWNWTTENQTAENWFLQDCFTA